MEDAFDQWRAELEAPDPGRGSFGPPRRRLSRSGDGGLGVACQVSAAAGGVVLTLFLVLALGFPLDVAPPSPLFLAVPAMGAIAGRIDGPERWRPVLAALLATAAGVVTFFVAVPAIAVLELLECWASWLADC